MVGTAADIYMAATGEMNNGFNKATNIFRYHKSTIFRLLMHLQKNKSSSV
ncbi:MAG: hypothetical protein BWX55_00189 [Deltaproteobacteria bacterium ADurb.Bin022]|nr:MAG: hypothetical protein BWX55_00189 [Deltaproteobacteria bacterium ADurb.Bin022]